MTLDQVKNFAKVTVSTGYDAAATSIVLVGGEGAKLPDPASGNYNLIWWDATSYGDPSDDPKKEIVRATAISTDTLTVTRNQEGSGASTKNDVGRTYKMILALTKKSYDEISTSTTVADTASSTTWPLLHEATTGTLAPKSDAGLTYNATTAALSATTFVGALTGHASADLALTGGSLSGALSITSSDAANATALTVTQQDTASAVAASITNASTGDGLFITQTGNGVGLHIDNNGTNNSITVEGTTATDITVAKSGATSIASTLTVGGVLTQNGANLAGTAYQSQSFQNLLQNGNFEFWYAGTAVAPTGWTLAGAGATIAREATIIKTKSYSAKLTRSGADTNIYQTFTNTYYKGRPVTVGAWVYATVASRARISIYDGVDTTYSSYHSGGSSWEFLTVTRTLSASATEVRAGVLIDTGDTSAYFDGAILVEGSVVPAFTEHPFDKVLNEVRFKVGSFTRDTATATGTQAVTGVGFKPSSVIFSANIGTTAAASWSGFDDGTIHTTMADYSFGSADTYNVYTDRSIELIIAAGKEYSGLISSMDSDGFTITWTKTSTPTGTATIIYMAFR